jgi:hypothetical protein
MRSLIYVLGGAPATDERNFKRLRASRAELEPGIELSDFKNLVREQFFILKLDREQALNSLPTLLAGSSNDDVDGYISHLEHVFAASGDLSEHAAERFAQIKALFDKARPRKSVANKPAASKPTVSKTSATTKPAAKPKAAIAKVAETQTTSPAPVAKEQPVVNKESVVKESSSKPTAASESASEPAAKPTSTTKRKKTPPKR